MHLIFITLISLSSSLFAGDDSISITIGKGLNKTITIRGLTKMAVGDPKILKVRSMSNDKVLLTALKTGKTMLRAWNSKNGETIYRIQVTNPAELNSSVVKIALEFLELNFSLGRELGIRWPDSVQFSGLGSIRGDGNITGLNLEAGFASGKGWIRHWVREGWAKILANPDLYVRLGEEAVFYSGGEFPIQSSSENYGRYQKHIEWKNYGLTAKVLPQSSDNLHIQSNIQLEISEPNPAGGVEGIPALVKRRLVTKMNSEDGETVILSGLVRKDESKEKAGLPFLSSIPLIGSFFSSTANEIHETELLMAVTFSFATKLRQNEKIKKFKNQFEGASFE